MDLGGALVVPVPFITVVIRDYVDLLKDHAHVVVRDVVRFILSGPGLSFGVFVNTVTEDNPLEAV